MGLFSKSGKNKQDTAGQDSGYYTSADDQAVLERARSKRASSADGPKRGRASREAADDPMLPEKKRARRRLVGAIALALTVAIVLPMMLDSEPKPLASDIDIKIPSKDKPADAAPAPVAATEAVPDASAVVTPATAAAPAAPAAAPRASAAPAPVPAAASLDKSEEIVSEPSRLVKPASTVADARAEKEKDAVKPKSEPEHKEAKAETKPEHKEAKAEPKPEPKVESKPEPKLAKEDKSAGDDARALAILEGKPSEANQKFVLQVAALSDRDKVDELQGKLKEAGIKSFTQKVPTQSGERTRIRVGPFSSKEEAEKVRAKLAKLGLNGSLVPG